MKHTILTILDTYLKQFPQEEKRQSILKKYLETHTNKEIADWNNFDGHTVAGGFIYAIKEQKFLVLHHKDLNMYVYPGGHIDETDKTPLEAAIREIKEETGLKNLKQLKLVDNELIPIDIDTHKIAYNKRLNLPEHHHFDFRYLFIINNIENIQIDTEESSCYKWIDTKDLYNDPCYGKIANKIERLLLTKINNNTINIKNI